VDTVISEWNVRDEDKKHKAGGKALLAIGAWPEGRKEDRKAPERYANDPKD
jgi:hypothetical protein